MLGVAGESRIKDSLDPGVPLQPGCHLESVFAVTFYP
jgi:hypothetical protein